MTIFEAELSRSHDSLVYLNIRLRVRTYPHVGMYSTAARTRKFDMIWLYLLSMLDEVINIYANVEFRLWGPSFDIRYILLSAEILIVSYLLLKMNKVYHARVCSFLYLHWDSHPLSYKIRRREYDGYISDILSHCWNMIFTMEYIYILYMKLKLQWTTRARTTWFWHTK